MSWKVSEGPKPATLPPASVCVVGLGNMGLPMATRLIAAGYNVIGCDAAAAAREAFLRMHPGQMEASLETAAASADAVITMLPNGKVVREVLDRMTPHMKPHAAVIDMSSSDPIATRALGEALIAKGFTFVDAPVSGGVKRAIDGTLAIMAGGDKASVDRIEKLLLAMGRVVFRTGPIGSGHAVKALNNYVSGAGLLAALEAMLVAKNFGVEPETLVDVLNASTGKNNSTEVKLKQFVISEKYDSGFFLGLMAKDIRTAQQLARQLGVTVPFGEKCADLWDAAAHKLGPDADHTAIHRYLAALSGDPS
jgi:3-hydroxyisobutyrate dehydrogenase